MKKHIAIIQGHPDPIQGHFGHSLALAYTQGALDAGHEVKSIEVALLQFPLLKSKKQWESDELPPGLHSARDTISWADHLLVIFPLWLGDMPAYLKGFFEQVLRPGFAFAKGTRGPFSEKLLSGKSARLIVTMGMPAIVYRWYFRAHSVKSLERNTLGFCGIAPIDETLIGSVDALDSAARGECMAKIRLLGTEAR